MAKYDPDEFFSAERKNKLTDCADCVTRNCMFRNRSADDVCRWFTPKKPTTNADCIRSLSDEELAEWLYNMCCIEEPFECPALSHPQKNVDCRKIWRDWLKSEVE